jgi:hypothetical protein
MLTHDVCSWWRQSPDRNVGHLEIVLRKDHLHILETELVGGLEPWNFMTFHVQLGMSSSQLTIRPSFFRGVGQPPTSGASFLGRSFWDDRWHWWRVQHPEVKPKYFVPLPPKLKPMDHWVGTPGREDWIEGWDLDVFRHFFHYKSCVYLCIYYILSIIIIHIY